MPNKMPTWAKEQVEDEKQSRGAEKAYNRAMTNTPPAPKKDAPIPRGGMIRSGGKMVPRFLRDTEDGAPIPRRGYKDYGQGLEAVPDESRKAKGGAVKKYATGGMVKRGWGKARCK